MPTGGILQVNPVAKQSTRPPPISKPRRHVLIVDDDEVGRRSLRRILSRDEKYLYTTSEAESVYEAKTCIEEQVPDCILLDYVLPGDSGLQLLEHVQDLLDDNPMAVILITGHGNRSLAVAAMRGGALDFLSKGELTPETLRRAVHNAIEKVDMRRELVTQRKLLEQKNLELEKTRERLEQQNRQFVANQRALLNMMNDLESAQQRQAGNGS